MANAIEKVNGITLANMETLMSRTDANIQNLNGLELTGIVLYTPVDGRNGTSQNGSISWDDDATNPDNTSDATMEVMAWEIAHDTTMTFSHTLTGMGASGESLVQAFFNMDQYDIGSHTGTWTLSIGGTEVLNRSTSGAYKTNEYGRNVTADTCAIVGTVHQVDDAGSGSSDKDKFWLRQPILGGVATKGSNGTGTSPVIVSQSHSAEDDFSGGSTTDLASSDWYEALGGSDTLQFTVGSVRIQKGGSESNDPPSTSNKVRIWCNVNAQTKSGSVTLTAKYRDGYASGSPTETTMGTATVGDTGTTFHRSQSAYFEAEADGSSLTPNTPGGTLFQFDILVYAKTLAGSPRFGAKSVAVAGLAREEE